MEKVRRRMRRWEEVWKSLEKVLRRGRLQEAEDSWKRLKRLRRMRTAGVGWTRLQTAEEDEVKAALGAGRLRQPQQDRPDGSGQDGPGRAERPGGFRAPSRFASRVGSRVYPRAGGGEARGGTGALTPSGRGIRGITEIRRDRNGQGARGWAYPKMRSRCPPPPSAPPPGGGDPPSVHSTALSSPCPLT